MAPPIHRDAPARTFFRLLAGQPTWITDFSESSAPTFQPLASLTTLRPGNRIVYWRRKSLNQRYWMPAGAGRGRHPGKWPSLAGPLAVRASSTMNQSFSKTLPNLAKPCQTAGRPEHASPSDEAAGTAPWRRSPDLPCRYSYRHKLRTPRTPRCIKVVQTIRASAPLSSDETNPISPKPLGIKALQENPRSSLMRAASEKTNEPNLASARAIIQEGSPLPVARLPCSQRARHAVPLHPKHATRDTKHGTFASQPLPGKQADSMLRQDLRDG